MSDYYAVLQARVDQQFDHLYRQYRANFSCREGCHQCCTPNLSISLVEATRIQQALIADPKRSDELLTLEMDNPHKGQRCAFLSADGRCSIYSIRPLICRSHGAPVMVPLEGEREALDACELNFTEGLTHLQQGDWISIETLNTQLSLINILLYKEHSGQRVTLTPSAILATEITTTTGTEG